MLINISLRRKTISLSRNNVSLRLINISLRLINISLKHKIQFILAVSILSCDPVNNPCLTRQR